MWIPQETSRGAHQGLECPSLKDQKSSSQTEPARERDEQGGGEKLPAGKEWVSRCCWWYLPALEDPPSVFSLRDRQSLPLKLNTEGESSRYLDTVEGVGRYYQWHQLTDSLPARSFSPSPCLSPSLDVSVWLLLFESLFGALKALMGLPYLFVGDWPWGDYFSFDVVSSLIVFNFDMSNVGRDAECSTLKTYSLKCPWRRGSPVSRSMAGLYEKKLPRHLLDRHKRLYTLLFYSIDGDACTNIFIMY